jgi:AraC-like DNA-binding protein
MMKSVRAFLGARWRPEWIELNYPRDVAAHLLERELNVPAYFGRPGIGVAIRSDMLDSPNLAFRHVAAPSSLTLLDVGSSEAATQFNEPVQSLFSIVVLRLLDGRSDMEGTALMAGIGVQTLQRRLRREGLTYRNLLDAARLRKARALLMESQQNITEIAFGLGYSDHANFTRAFTRWMSCSPSEYRRVNATVEIR